MPRRHTPSPLRSIVCALTAFALTGGCGDRTRSPHPITIGIAQFVSHPSLDAAEKGFVKALADAGYREGSSVVYVRKNAQGDMTNAVAIAQEFATGDLDLVLTITTPSSQAIVRTVKGIPIVFTAVTDPVSAGIVPAGSEPGQATGTSITGVSDHWPIFQQLEMYTHFVPAARTWGTIYNAGDANSVVHIKEMRTAAARLGVSLVESTVASSADVMAAAQYLADEVQAMNITSDNIAASAFESITKVCNEQKIPLFAGDTDAVVRGAVAAYGLDYLLIGEESGRKAVRILRGEDAGAIPWGPAEQLSLAVNLRAAGLQGVTIPTALLQQAKRIIR